MAAALFAYFQYADYLIGQMEWARGMRSFLPVARCQISPISGKNTLQVR
jgi:hypothetical protein